MKLSHFLYCLKRASDAVFFAMKNASSTQERKGAGHGYEMMTPGNTMEINFPETERAVDTSKSDSENSSQQASGHAPEHAHSHHDAAHSHDSVHHASDTGHSCDASSSCD